jgi:hypothetical protein
MSGTSTQYKEVKKQVYRANKNIFKKRRRSSEPYPKKINSAFTAISIYYPAH